MAEESTIAAEDSGSIVANVVNTVTEAADHDHEKAWWQSKKFFAFLIAELGFFVLMGIMIYEQEMDKLGDNMAFMVLAVTSGVLACSYIGGQALVDKYIRVAKITMGKGDTTATTNGNGEE